MPGDIDVQLQKVNQRFKGANSEQQSAAKETSSISRQPCLSNPAQPKPPIRDYADGGSATGN